MDTTGFEGTLLDHAVDIIVVLDRNGEFRYANAAVERVLGYDPASLVGRNALELIHPEERAAVVDVFGRLVAADADVEMTDWTEFRYRAAGGSYTWLAARMSSQPSASSGGYVVSCRDVDARRRAERERRRAREQLLHIAEHTDDVLWMFSADWEELLFVNSAYEELWGRSTGALERDPGDFLRGIHPSDRESVRRAMGRLSAGESVDITYRVNAERDFGTWVWVQGHPIADDDGTVTHVVGFARDVSERRERERQLLVMDRLLRHNLRNEMNVILGHAEEVRTSGGEAVDADVDRIVEAGERLLRTVDKERDVVALLTDTREPEVLDVVRLVEDACEQVSEAYPAATVETTLPGAATGAEARTEPKPEAGAEPRTSVRAVPRLALAVAELLTNAIEHATDDAPTVWVDLDVGTERVEIGVVDECPAIPLQEIRVLRGERDVRSLYHGSGLGLWLVYWAVDRSGGDLDFEPTERGNTVTVTLDRAAQL
jgi:PAS domain S-box-containing protein